MMKIELNSLQAYGYCKNVQNQNARYFYEASLGTKHLRIYTVGKAFSSSLIFLAATVAFFVEGVLKGIINFLFFSVRKDCSFFYGAQFILEAVVGSTISCVLIPFRFLYDFIYAIGSPKIFILPQLN